MQMLAIEMCLWYFVRDKWGMLHFVCAILGLVCKDKKKRDSFGNVWVVDCNKMIMFKSLLKFIFILGIILLPIVFLFVLYFLLWSTLVSLVAVLNVLYK